MDYMNDRERPKGFFGWGPFEDFGDRMQDAGYTPDDCELLPELGPDGEPQYKINKPGPHFTHGGPAGGVFKYFIDRFSAGGVTGRAENVDNPKQVLNIVDADVDTNWFQEKKG